MLNKKIKEILIGTNNTGKLREIKGLMPKSLKLYSTKDFRIKSPAENGKTFLENSLIKAKYFSKRSKLICIADASGLEVDILNGAPGIYSSRWGGKKNDFNKAIKKVYSELNKKDKKWKLKKIKARFICAISLSFLNKKIVCVKGKIEGTISLEPKGKNGFGYDPIFIPNNEKKTFGEMSLLKKYRMDHRFQAFNKIRRFL